MFLLFFKELLFEENVTKTRMDAENISIVFTPSFMRCSSVPQTSLLDNVDKERSFIHRLVSSCDTLLAKYNLTPSQSNQPAQSSPLVGEIPGDPPGREGGSWKSVTTRESPPRESPSPRASPRENPNSPPGQNPSSPPGQNPSSPPGQNPSSPPVETPSPRENPSPRASQLLREGGSWKSVRIPSPTSATNPARPQLSPLTRLASQKFQQN